VKTARALAKRVRERDPVPVSEFSHGIQPGLIEAAVAHAVGQQWVVTDGDLLYAGAVDPTPLEPPVSELQRRGRWGPGYIG